MSNSPVKIVGAAARVASGGSANPGSTGTKPSIDQMIGIFGGAFKKNKRLERAKRAQALADYKERAAMTGRQRMRAQRIQAARHGQNGRYLSFEKSNDTSTTKKSKKIVNPIKC